MDSMPLQITTSKEKVTKKVQIDGYTFMVRRMGAGEALTSKQLGREMTRIETKSEKSKADIERYDDLYSQSLAITIKLFDAMGNRAAQAHLDSLPATVLWQALGQIFGEVEVKDATDSELSEAVS